ncbi:ABC transporter substrate-binding protein [Paenibacillus sp. NPDC058071]|uniref:ABC transporter substrate-binding protein n=1 Tax=Paenibacillus sp. NPDC058071 TaxID=3346326 RepID=UPI0036DE4B85
MRLKTVSAWVMILVLLVTAVGCSQSSDGKTDSAKGNGDSGDKIKLTVYSSTTEQSAHEVLRSIVDEYTQQNPNISVDLQFPGTEYESIMKVKMAANDLPDIFDTHGWAKVRYSKYLADLRDEPWAAEMTDTIKPVVTDDTGKVNVLVLSEAKDGLTYNADVLKKFNIPVPKTYKELLDAAEKITKESNGEVSPFFMSGIDNGSVGGYLDLFASSMFISHKQNDEQSLLDGTFDWNKWTPFAQMLLDLKTKGYVNVDVLTAKGSDLPQRFAQDKVAFVIGGPAIADDVHKLNPNTEIGIMPLPAIVDGDEPILIGGERYSFGAWKDGKNLEESKKLIAFFAQPENLAKVANVSKLAAGLKGVTTDHEFSKYFDEYADVRVFPYFDRVYLPNGMWDVLCKTGTALLAGAVTPEQFSEKMKQEYERLRTN